MPTSTDGPDAGRPLRVLFAVTHGARAPGPRYRVFQYLPHLEAAGLACTVIVRQDPRASDRSVRSVLLSPPVRAWHDASLWIRNVVLQCRLVALAPRYDRVVLYRVPISQWTRWLLRPLRGSVVTDFDDALDAIDSDDGEYLGALRRWILRRGLTNGILASSIAVTSNEHNCTVIEQHGGRALVIPTSIDVDRIPFRDRRERVEPALVIGWMGTPSTARYLAAIEPALCEVARQRAVVIRLVGAGRTPFCALDAEIRDWSFEHEADELRRFDIGIMPMPDTPWTRGKAATKALQYGASGAPTVAALTGTNLAILGTDVGALFARSHEDWTSSLIRLIDDPDLRSRMGRCARERVAAQFSVRVNAPRLVRVIRTAGVPASGG